MKITAFFRITTALAVALFFGACSNGSVDAPAFSGSTEIPGGAENPTPAQSDTNTDNGDNNGDASTPTSIDALIAALNFPAAGSDALVAPNEDDRTSLTQVIHDLIDGNTVAESTLTGLNYKLTALTLDGQQIQALEDTSGEGGGTYLINQSSSSKLILEVPHPVFDTNTLAEGAFLFKNLKAKALLIAGTHRCANAAESACSGTTDACGANGAYRISDVAHHTGNLFHTAHKALHDKVANSIFISLHGFSAEEGDPTVIVSNGKTNKVGQFAFVNQLDTALETALGDGKTSASCNLVSDSWEKLCGTSNVQGRFTNGSVNECTEAPVGLTGRFIHLEQDATTRENESGWQAVADALTQVF